VQKQAESDKKSVATLCERKRLVTIAEAMRRQPRTAWSFHLSGSVRKNARILNAIGKTSNQKTLRVLDDL
jgi:hypothetical protein